MMYRTEDIYYYWAIKEWMGGEYFNEIRIVDDGETLSTIELKDREKARRLARDRRNTKNSRKIDEYLAAHPELLLPIKAGCTVAMLKDSGLNKTMNRLRYEHPRVIEDVETELGILSTPK
jgi:hypothetical protein